MRRFSPVPTTLSPAQQTQIVRHLPEIDPQVLQTAITDLQNKVTHLVTHVQNLNEHMAEVSFELTMNNPRTFKEVLDYVDFKAEHPELGLAEFKNVQKVNEEFRSAQVNANITGVPF